MPFKMNHSMNYSRFLKKFLIGISLIVVSCAAGPCKNTVDRSKTGEMAVLPTERVRVYKPDGSLQCGMGKGTPVADMQKELKGIKVHKSENKPDGLMHIQLCGSPTGLCNVYEIDKSDLETAKSFGFKEWTWD